MRRSTRRTIFAVVSMPLALMALPSVDAQIGDRSAIALVAELGLQQSLESAYGEADSLIPIPDLGKDDRMRREIPEPTADGSLDEDFWSHASSFLWTVVGNSGFRSEVSWRVLVARRHGTLWLGGVCESGDPATLTLLSGSSGEIFMDFRGPAGPKAVFQCRSSTREIEEPRGEFRAMASEGVWRFEMRILELECPWELPFGATQPLRMTATVRGTGNRTVSPAFRLIRSDVALRVEGFDVSEPRTVTARVRLLNRASKPLVVRYDYNDEEVIDPGTERAHEFTKVAAQNARGLGWSFNAEHVACRVGLPTAFVDPDVLREEIHVLQTRAQANLGWLASARTEWQQQLSSIQQALAGADGASFAALEELLLEARVLVRQTFLGRLPADLASVAFVRRHPFRAGPFYTTYANDMRGGDARLLSLQDDSTQPLVTLNPGESIRDLAMDFAAQNVVFAVREQKDATHLYVQSLAGRDRRAITTGPFHDIEPCFLPNNEVVFTSNRHGAQSPINTTDNFCLHVVSPETGDVRRLSHNNLMDFTPAVLDDGRILFLRWVHEDKPGNFINALWTVYPDGRGLSGFFGMNRVGMSIEPQPIPDTNRIVCIDSGKNGHWRSPHVGALAVVDFQASANKFQYRIERTRGGFKNPYPVAPEAFLVSGGWIDTRWAIFAVDRYGNEEVIHRDARYSCFNPIPVRARPTPNVIPNLTSKDRTKPAKILIQDVYEGLPGIERGVARKLRVVHSAEKPRLARHGFLDQTVPLGINNRALRRDLGTVPVHEDGSVYLEVPPQTNVFFQVLDERGRLIQTMRDSVSFAPGEFRACVGCHEDRSRTPVKEPLGMVHALRHEPAQIDLEGFSSVVSFNKTVQPILDSRCVACHNSREAAGNVNLSGDLTPYFSVAYETLLRGGEVYQTQYAGEKSRPVASSTLVAGIQNVTQLLPPNRTGSAVSALLKLVNSDHHGVALEDHEEANLARWIDFNRPFYGDWESGRLGEERRLLSARSEDVISSIMRRRCRGCHLPTDLFRGASVNVSSPRASPILRAPLPYDEWKWGTGLCRTTIFRNDGDRDYRAILEALEADRRRYREAQAR